MTGPRIAHPDAPSRVPVSSYRLQFNQAFGFRDAAAIVDYLQRLGVTECYASPLLTASPGSPHGYDICDHNALSPDLGGTTAFDTFVAALQREGLGLVLDFVPNHMGNDPRTNAWWRDVLENGPSSPWAAFFDIDWEPLKPELQDKVLLPILGDQYGLVLERSELQLQFDRGLLELTYFDKLLPINPRQSPRVFRHGLDALRAESGDADPDVRELMSIMTALSNLPPYTDRDPDRIVERQREKEVARERLDRLVGSAPRIRRHIDESVRFANGTPGDRASYDLLHELLEVQAYRLAYWRTAADEINYRRFFDINALAALRMEDPRVFEATHGLLLDLVSRGIVTGVRIDHPDGLFDPTAYFDELQRAAAQAGARATAAADPPSVGSRPSPSSADPPGSAAGGRAAGRAGSQRDPAPEPGAGAQPARSLYVVAEKILSDGERLPDTWSVHGTTGYNFLNVLNGLFVRGDRLDELQRAYHRFTGERRTAADEVYASKRLIMATSMSSELQVLAHALNRLSETDRRTRDFTLNSLRRALLEVVACFPVYRTYVNATGARAEDERIIDDAIAEARRRNPVLEPSIFAFIRSMLVPTPSPSSDDDRARAVRTQFAMKFQQYTGPVEAKGLEDTAFYRQVPLVSTNEVGGDPHHRAWTAAEFHAANAERLRAWPFEMTTTATHDTKRGEDTRARIDVLSELPGEWRRLANRWAAMNQTQRGSGPSGPAPDRTDEWLFYQTLTGVWPAEPPGAPVPDRAPDALVDRLCEYMTKAVKEAKRHTSWINPSAGYDEATNAFVRQTLGGSGAGRFLASFVPWARRVAWFGMVNSLAQVVLRQASPGVPDLYQGAELWDLSLVDPDNRRPVDFAARRTVLASLEPLLEHVTALRVGTIETVAPEHAAALSDLVDGWWDGRAKLYATSAALRLRRAWPAVFLAGDYVPFEVHPADDHVVAFARRFGDDIVIAIAPRFLATMQRGEPSLPLGLGAWPTARIALPADIGRRTFANVLTGEVVRPLSHRGTWWLLAGDVFTAWPVALLASR